MSQGDGGCARSFLASAAVRTHPATDPSMTTPAHVRPVVAPPPVGRVPQRGVLDDPGIPRLVRWYVGLTSYLIHPRVLRHGTHLRTAGTLEPLAADREWRIAPPLLAYMAGAERTLVERGFSAPFRAINGGISAARSFVSFVEHPHHATIGFVLVAEGDHLVPSALATFRTDFVDGVQVVTSNAHTATLTPGRAQVLGVRFPDVHDVGALYELHRFRVEERAAAIRVAALSRGGDPIAFQECEARELHELWVRVGYYEPAGPGALRLTRRGACLAAWRGLFPWKQLTNRRDARAAAAVRSRRAAARNA